MKTRCIAAVAAALAVGVGSAAAETCDVETNVVLKNATGRVITHAIVIHRQGKSTGVASFGEWSNIAPGGTTKPTVVRARATTTGTQLNRFDHWTVVFSFKESAGDKEQDKVFLLNPHNGRRALERAQTALLDAAKTLTLSKLKELVPEPSHLGIEAVVKVAAAALGDLKSGSLANYKTVNLRCDDHNKTTSITLGSTEPGHKRRITIVTQRHHDDGSTYEPTLINPDEMMRTIQSRLEEKTDDRKKS
jgi:hypothetical protein